MNDGPLIFPIVPYKYGTLSNHHEVASLPDKFFLSSLVVPMLADYEDIRCSKEVIDIF